jgi:type IV pilus assembly protein PilF
MMRQRITLAFVAATLVLVFAAHGLAQSGASRPRRVNPTPVATPTPTPRNETNAPAASANAARNNTTTPSVRPSANTATSATASSATARAFSLYQQKLYDAALREAKQAAAADPNNSEAFKVAGFAGVALRKYEEAATDLQRALDLQRAAGEEDPNTVAELAQTYVRVEKFDLALPLLVAATTRTGATPDAGMLFFRGLAEYRTGKAADAERSFNAAVKLDPKNSLSLFYLGRMALERKDNDAAVTLLNRATTADARLAEAWTLLTHAYLRRAAASPATAAADRLGAVRASETLARLRPDEASAVLHAQTLIQAEQFARAAAALERFSTLEATQGQTLYLLGLSHSRAKNFPKAAAVLERAAAKSANDVNIYRELGYVYHSSKQYAKALAAYERGLQLAPDDADLKAAAEQVRPFAK